MELTFQEVTIPMPYGYISGKWWRPKNVRPILCLHGWQDNAGAFDRIIPLLPKHIGYLAIDLIGHGRSSRLPKGIIYNYWEQVYIIKIIKDTYKWNKVSIMAHSKSAILAYYYASLYPEDIDLVISFDPMKFVALNSDHFMATNKHLFDLFLSLNKKVETDVEPPSYTHEEIIKKLIEGSQDQHLDEESAHFLVERGTSPSKIFPNKYYFSRDIRLKGAYRFFLNDDSVKEMLNRVQCPHLCFINLYGRIGKDTKYCDMFLNASRENNLNFEHYYVNGSHYMHMTHINKIIDATYNFINKYYPPENDDGKNNKIMNSKL